MFLDLLACDLPVISGRHLALEILFPNGVSYDSNREELSWSVSSADSFPTLAWRKWRARLWIESTVCLALLNGLAAFWFWPRTFPRGLIRAGSNSTILSYRAVSSIIA
jgi:hypothetical protein